jgi:dsRNA-specific ribonuclease
VTVIKLLLTVTFFILHYFKPNIAKKTKTTAKKPTAKTTKSAKQTPTGKPQFLEEATP